MDDKFVPLHLHTVYSIYDGLGKSADYVKKAVEFGHKAMAITDHGRMGGLVEHRDACLKNGIKPISGIEAYITSKLLSEDENGKRTRTKNNHVILLAKNDIGYRNILKLNYLSNSDETHFYYHPRITFNELFENSEGIICGSACLASSFSNLLKLGREEAAEELFNKFIEVFKDNFYAEIQMNEVTTDEGGLLQRGQFSYNKWLIEKATRNGVPIVVAGDVHYANHDDYLIQQLSFNLREDKETDEEFVCKSLYYHNTEDFLRFNKDFGYNYKEDDLKSWIENSCYIASKIDFVIPVRDRMLLPRVEFDEEDVLVKKVKDGLCNHFKTKSFEDIPKEYLDRAEVELSLILKKGVSRYFLILNDICEYADKENITRGPSRGSAGGSLIACALGITKWSVDPLKNGLLFERFISETRLPDMVIDYFAKDVM